MNYYQLDAAAALGGERDPATNFEILAALETGKYRSVHLRSYHLQVVGSSRHRGDGITLRGENISFGADNTHRSKFNPLSFPCIFL